MGEHGNTQALAAVVLLLGTALLSGWALRRLRLPTVVGYLASGLLIGPSGLGLIAHGDVDLLAELALVLLLFVVGLELSPEPIRRSGRALLVVTLAQVALTALAVTVVLVGAFALPLLAAALVGCAVSLSSTAIVLKQLAGDNQLETPAGSLIVGVLLLQDIGVVMLMAALPLLGGASAGSAFGRGAFALVAGLMVVLGARLALPRLVDSIFGHGGRELLTVFAVLMACAGAWAAGMVGWSWPLGAFLAGLMLAATDLRHQFVAEITPFRDVFDALFFVAIGMLVDLELWAQRPLLLAAGAVLALFGKTILAAAATLLGGFPLRLGVHAGLGLCTISEFGFVLLREARQHGLVAPGLVDGFVAVAVATMVVGALVVPFAGALALRVSTLAARWRGERREASVQSPAAESSGRHVMVVGYGLNGQNLAAALRAARIPFCVIELDRSLARLARAHGDRVLVGDATRAVLLDGAGLQNARMLVVCISDRVACRQIVAQAHRRRPELFVLARTRQVAEVDVLYRLGARLVIPEEFETSIEIFSHVLEEFRVPHSVIDQQIALARAGRYGMLRGRPSDRAVQAEWLRALEKSATQTVLIEPGSPAAGKTLAELDLRARTGTTMVAVTRDGRPTASPGPEFRLAVGDVVVVVGSHAQLDQAQPLLVALSPPEAAAPPDEGAAW